MIESKKSEIYNSSLPWTQEEKNVKSSFSISKFELLKTFSSIVDELLIKIGENKYCFIPNNYVGNETDDDVVLIFKGNLQEILDNMDAYC